MDLTDTIQPKSDQINADSLIGGDITVTVAAVRQGNAEQPVNIDLVERPGRAYRPNRTMRRLLVAAWGSNGDAYVGRRLTLHRNPDVTFGKHKVGGIEIVAMSHIDRPLSVPLTATRGSKRVFTVQPIAADVQTVQPMPEFATYDDAVTYWRQRKAEGATEAELAEIASVGATLKAETEQ